MEPQTPHTAANLTRLMEQVADAIMQHQARLDAIAYRVQALELQLARLVQPHHSPPHTGD